MSRVQLALNVADLEEAVTFYSALFSTVPHKRRPGYANFEIADPPLKLVLIEVGADARGTGVEGSLNHLGVEVDSSRVVQDAAERLSSEGLQVREEMATTCCYAKQDKVWVNDPAGTPWEVYVVTDDEPATLQVASSDGSCCASPSSQQAGPRC